MEDTKKETKEEEYPCKKCGELVLLSASYREKLLYGSTGLCLSCYMKRP